MKLNKTCLFIFLATYLFSCKPEDESKKPLSIPNNYNAANFDANSSKEQTSLDQIENLIETIEKGQSIDSSVSYSELLSIFNSSNAIVQSGAFSTQIKANGGWLEKASKASKNSYNPLDSNGKGGVLGGYLFDEKGIDLAEMVEKTMFGSVLYKRAAQLLLDSLNAASVDKTLAMLGGNPTFPNTSSAIKASRPDAFIFKYISRRDKNDGNGMYTKLKADFVTLQAAIAAGNDYKTEQNAAVQSILTRVEKAMAASVINYCKSVQSTLSNTNLTNANKGSALHALTEAIGFLYGLKGLGPNRKLISDAQIDALLADFNFAENGQSTCFRFVLNPVKELPKMQKSIDALQSIYGFTNQEVADFAKNWIAEQGR